MLRTQKAETMNPHVELPGIFDGFSTDFFEPYFDTKPAPKRQAGAPLEIALDAAWFKREVVMQPLALNDTERRDKDIANLSTVASWFDSVRLHWSQEIGNQLMLSAGITKVPADVDIHDATTFARWALKKAQESGLDGSHERLVRLFPDAKPVEPCFPRQCWFNSMDPERISDVLPLLSEHPSELVSRLLCAISQSLSASETNVRSLARDCYRRLAANPVTRSYAHFAFGLDHYFFPEPEPISEEPAITALLTDTLRQLLALVRSLSAAKTKRWLHTESVASVGRLMALQFADAVRFLEPYEATDSVTGDLELLAKLLEECKDDTPGRIRQDAKALRQAEKLFGKVKGSGRESIRALEAKLQRLRQNQDVEIMAPDCPSIVNNNGSRGSSDNEIEEDHKNSKLLTARAIPRRVLLCPPLSPAFVLCSPIPLMKPNMWPVSLGQISSRIQFSEQTGC